MARTVINETAVGRDTGVNTAAAGVYQAADNTNGMYLADVGKAETLLLHVKNTNAATRDVTIKAGAGSTQGAAFRAGLGDLKVTVAATSGEDLIWITDTMRFKQANGQIYVDISGANVTIAAYRLTGVAINS